MIFVKNCHCTTVFYRLFGLTAIIHTDCENPTRLLLHSDLEYPTFVNPALLMILLLLLATDLRLWINTPVSYVHYQVFTS